MGLDMYLTGRKYIWQNWEYPEQDRMEDDYRVEEVRVRLGYWRKHPNLHGFIVKQFAKGEDDCQEIFLTPDDCRTIIEAIKTRSLPETSGFFFGKSDGSERDEDIAIFENAISWAEVGNVSIEPDEVTEIAGGTLRVYKTDRKWPKDSRDIIYRASW